MVEVGDCGTTEPIEDKTHHRRRVLPLDPYKGGVLVVLCPIFMSRQWLMGLSFSLQQRKESLYDTRIYDTRRVQHDGRVS